MVRPREPSATGMPRLAPILAFTDLPQSRSLAAKVVVRSKCNRSRGGQACSPSRPKDAATVAPSSTPWGAACCGAPEAGVCRRYSADSTHLQTGVAAITSSLLVLPSPEPDAEGGGTRPETVAQRIAAFFDPRGVLNAQAPRHWTMAACRFRPFHQARPLEHLPQHLNKRRQEINARNTLERSQRKVNDELHASVVCLSKVHKVDAQEVRYLRLLFEPLTGLSGRVLQELASELHDDESARMEGDKGGEVRDTGNGRPGLARGTCRDGGAGPASLHGMLGLAMQETPSNNHTLAEVPLLMSPSHASGLLKGNGHRQVLQALHQHYVYGVTGEGAAERTEVLRRSSWFRFLYHCGLLYAPDGVTAGQAAEVFDRFAVLEAGDSPVSGLCFTTWVTAVQHLLLKSGTRQGTESEIICKFFDVSIKQCRDKLEKVRVRQELARRAHKHRPASSASAATVSLASGAPPPPCGRSPSPVAPPRAGGLLGWQAALAEERMCEPEVLQLVQEFHAPLRRLFRHYAAHGERTAAFAAGLAAGQGPAPTDDLSSDEQDSRGAALPRPRASGGAPRVRLSPRAFQALLEDFQFFPEVVQVYALRQHLQISLAREGAEELAFPAFVECLLRIAFVYLDVYGNDVQQAAPSRLKCLWLLGMLSVQCCSLGEELGLPAKLIGTPSSPEPETQAEAEADAGGGSHGWFCQKRPCVLDSIPLRQLILSRTLDNELAGLPEPHAPLPASPAHLALRPGSRQSPGGGQG